MIRKRPESSLPHWGLGSALVSDCDAVDGSSTALAPSNGLFPMALRSWSLVRYSAWLGPRADPLPRRSTSIRALQSVRRTPAAFCAGSSVPRSRDQTPLGVEFLLGFGERLPDLSSTPGFSDKVQPERGLGPKILAGQVAS